LNAGLLEMPLRLDFDTAAEELPSYSISGYAIFIKQSSGG
jgi:hypothetical protein